MFSYIHDIKFLTYQFNRYLGTDSWGWSLIGDLVGVSNSTVRKYAQNLDYPYDHEKELEIIYQKMQACDFNQDPYKIQLFCYYPKDYYLYRDGSIVARDPDKKIEIENKNISIQKLKSKYYITNSPEGIITAKWPTSSGVYMFCQITCPANDPSQIKYLVKVGKSTNLNARISAYKGMNPYASCIDVKLLSPKETDAAEIKYHQIMNKRYERYSNTEWFIVSFDDYKEFLEYGFEKFK